MTLSIIIVNYNVRELVIKCITSIHTFLTSTDFEIIVVDNNSTDGSANAIKDKFPDITIIHNPSNLGFSEANNQGINAAKGDYILLLNPDIYLIDNSLCKLLTFLKEKEQPTLAAPKLLNPDQTLQYSAWKDKGLSVMFLETFRYFNTAYPLEQFKTAQAVQNISGAAMLFPKKLIEKIGFFDKNLFWMEDFDFCYRVRKKGLSVYYYPEASVVHLGGQSSETNIKVATANFILSKLAFYRKHYPGFRALLAFILILMHIIGYLIFLLPMSIFGKRYGKKIMPYLYTLRYFFKGYTKVL